jgi:hypothetical protein
MLITVFEYLNLLQETCTPTADLAGVWTPPMFASMQVFVFEDQWLDDEFTPFWLKYLDRYRDEHNLPLENNSQRGICDEITERCGSLFSEAARKKVGDVDCRAGAMFTRIRLPGGVVLNRVAGPGGHELLVVATRPASKRPEDCTYKDVTLRAYEDQNGLHTPVADAVSRGVVFSSQWV